MDSDKDKTNGNVEESHPIVSRARPLVLFVILPIVFLIISVYFPNFGLPISPHGHYKSLQDSLWSFAYDGIRWGILLLIIVCYEENLRGLSKLRHPGASERKSKYETFLATWHPSDAIVELGYLEKIAYFAIPITIFFTLISEIQFYFPDFSSKGVFTHFYNFISTERVDDISFILLSFYVFLIIYIIILLVTPFRFYLAKTMFRVAEGKVTKLDKMKFYVRGVKEYNKFLRRNLHFQLDELKIFSINLSDNSIKEKVLISSFNSINQLEPIAYFKKIAGNTDILLQTKTIDKIKEAILFVVAILPLIFPLLVTLFPEYSSRLRELIK